MDILLLQAAPLWQSPRENLACFGEMIAEAPAADLILLPEMFATGFVTDPAGVEGSAEIVLEWMLRVAREKEAAVAGSTAVEEKGRVYNRCYFVKPGGSVEKYDKRHLFAVGGEDREYTAGNERVIVEWAGFRILLQVCYDLRFPVFSRNRGDYDMALYLASWPDVRRGVWDVLLRARAIENVCYVAGVNRVGCDPLCRYDGGTGLVDFRGDVLSAAADGKEGIVHTRADMGRLVRFREKFPVLADADDFGLKLR